MRMEEAADVDQLIKETLSTYVASPSPSSAKGDGQQRGCDRRTFSYSEHERPASHVLETTTNSGSRRSVRSVPGVAGVKEAVGLIPNEEKAAFVEACYHCPALIQQESHPNTFLVRHGYDVLKASQGLVQYWAVRREIFGDRAYLPLNLTRKGALSDEDVEALRSGFLLILPPDNLGRHVLFSDFSRLRDPISDGVLLRAAFFMLSVLSCGKDAAKTGYIRIDIYNKELKAVLERPAVTTMLARLFEEDMPTFARSTYVAKLQKWALMRLLQSSPDLSTGLWKHVTPLIASSVDQLREKVQRLHFNLSSIPEILGGSWNIRNFHAWFHAQETLDPGISSAAVVPLATSSQLLVSSTAVAAATRGGDICMSTTNTSSSSSTMVNVDARTKDVLEAIQFIPSDMKLAFLEAMATCPFLVRTESNPGSFLRCESGDTVAAACRLVRYWESRKIFLKDRAFKPMTFLSGGVFSDIDRQRLKDFRTFRVLPCDRRGRPVLWWDPLYDKDLKLTMEEKLKYWFYLSAIMAEETSAQEQGILFIIVPHPSVGVQLSSQSLRSTILNSFPVKSLEMHCCVVTAAIKERSNVEHVSLALNSLPRDTQGCIGFSEMEMCNELISIGLGKDGIPVEYGGSWGLEEDQLWRQTRFGVEENRKAALVFQPFPDAILPLQSGTTNMVQDDTVFLKTNFQETMNDAVARLPETEKSALVHALTSCLDVVRSESDMWKYVGLEPGNLPEAARRVAQYWRLRQELFGDAAFLPMVANLENVQALNGNANEEETSSTSPIVVLPELDYHGRHVVYVDNVGDFSSVAWRRAAFSVFASMCRRTDQLVKLEVMEVMLIFRAGALDNSVVSNLKVLVNLINQTFPFQLVRLFVCSVLENGEAQAEQHELGNNSQMPWSCLQQLAIRRELGERLASWTTVQSASNNRDLINKLSEVHGITLQSLRTTILVSAAGDANKKKAPVIAAAARGQLKVAPGADVPVASSENFADLLEQAMQQVPIAERHHYDEAKSEAPDLVANESRPTLFFNFENRHPQRAAERLARYWRQRDQAFGNVAFRPLNQTGSGALNKKDLTTMSSGYIALLPKDNEERPVLLHDSSRLERVDTAAEIRNLFYWAMIFVQEHEIVVQRGVVLLIIYHEKTTASHMTRLFDLTNRCFPFRYHSAHVFSRDLSQSDLECLARSMSSLPGAEETRIQVHSVVDDAVLAKLQMMGFDKDGVPESLGGAWSYENFALWQDRRTRLEWELPIGVGKLDGGLSYKAKPRSKLTEEEQAERKRRLNIIHSRRKRQRERLEHETLQIQLDQLQVEQKRLLLERQRLESLLNDAKQLLAGLP